MTAIGTGNAASKQREVDLKRTFWSMLLPDIQRMIPEPAPPHHLIQLCISVSTPPEMKRPRGSHTGLRHRTGKAKSPILEPVTAAAQLSPCLSPHCTSGIVLSVPGVTPSTLIAAPVAGSKSYNSTHARDWPETEISRLNMAKPRSEPRGVENPSSKLVRAVRGSTRSQFGRVENSNCTIKKRRRKKKGQTATNLRVPSKAYVSKGLGEQ